MIAVSDLSPPEVKLFNRSGRYLRTIARTGRGPGEVTWPGPPQFFARDSFFVVEREIRRVLFFDSAANPVLTRSFALQIHDGRSTVMVGMVSPNQFVAMLTVNTVAKPGEKVRVPVEIVTGHFGGNEELQPVTRGLGDQKVGGIFTEGGNQLPVAYPLEFGSTTQVALADRIVYKGETGVPLIEAFDLSGHIVARIRWDAGVDSVTEADRRSRIVQESTRISAQAQGSDPAQLWSSLEHLRRVALPKRAPAFASILPAVGGMIWVEQDPRPWTQSRKYLVFDSTGKAIANLTVPRQLRLFQVADSVVVGRWREPDIPDQVRVYKIIR